MKYLSPLIFLLVFSANLNDAFPGGIEPRGSVSDYPAHSEIEDGAIGASLLTPEQVRSTFASDLNRGYAVIEVSVYPQAGKSLELARRHFLLKISDGTTLSRPADPKTIAAILQRTASVDREVTLYPSVGIGYESGRRVYDPVTGTQRGGGLRTSAGVGVGVDHSPSGSSEQDRKTMELELSEKGLPEGTASKPLCGYLYFPLTSKKKNTTYQLEYSVGGGKVLLKLQP